MPVWRVHDQRAILGEDAKAEDQTGAIELRKSNWHIRI